MIKFKEKTQTMPESITLTCLSSEIDFSLIIRIVTFSRCIVIHNFSINANVLPEPTGTREKISSLSKRKEISHWDLYPKFYQFIGPIENRKVLTRPDLA
jgi:hypothetical protein